MVNFTRSRELVPRIVPRAALGVFGGGKSVSKMKWRQIVRGFQRHLGDPRLSREREQWVSKPGSPLLQSDREGPLSISVVDEVTTNSV
jgi:hypothetical protein